MLWDYIYEFFVSHIFGGTLEDVAYTGYLGTLYYTDDFTGADFGTNELFITKFDVITDGAPYQVFMSLGNYLSLIATIISIVAIVLFCVFIIKKIIGIIFRLFTGSSAF